MKSLLVACLLHLANLSGCATPREGVHEATPVDVATSVGMAAGELASATSQEDVLGWKLEFVGDRARFFSCTSEDACGTRAVDIPAKALLGMKVVGRTRPERADTDVDVVRLTIARGVVTSRGGVATDPTRGLVDGPAK